MCSRPALPNICGIGAAASQPPPPTTIARRWWSMMVTLELSMPAPSEPFCIFSMPRASVQSARPPRIALRARNSADEPVAQALATVITGMPVMPVSYRARCPIDPYIDPA